MRKDLAIDLGTANTLVFREGDGIVFNEPTVIAMNSRTGEVLAMGEDAWDMIGNLVVDVGGGTSEMAVISMGGVVTGRALRVGGFELDAAIQQHIRRAYGMAIGERTSEGIKMAIGSAYPTAAPGVVEVRGREISTGMPKKIEVSEEEVREA